MLKGQVHWTLKFTTFDDEGMSRLTETVPMKCGFRAVEMAYEIIKMEKWVNVQVIEHGREHGPEIQFDWRFYNQPEWARHILDGADDE